MLEDFVILAGQVHKVDTGCGGPLSTDGPVAERSSEVGMKCVCLGCGANFGQLSMGGTDSVATVLGVLLAGSTHGALSATCAYADRALMTKQTFHSTQKKILRVIDSSFEEFLLKSRAALHGEASRKILVPKDGIFFLEHEQELYNLMDTSFGLKVEPQSWGNTCLIHVPCIVRDDVVFLLRSQGIIPLAGIRTGELPVSSYCSNALRCHFLFYGLRQFGPDRSENMRPMEMAVNLLRCRRQELGGENWKPQYRVVGDMVELTGVEVRLVFCGLRQFGPDRSENMRSMEMVVNLLRCRGQEVGG